MKLGKGRKVKSFNTFKVDLGSPNKRNNITCCPEEAIQENTSRDDRRVSVNQSTMEERKKEKCNRDTRGSKQPPGIGKHQTVRL